MSYVHASNRFPIIHQNSRSINDIDYIRLHHQDNMKRSDLSLQNYRQVKYTNNPNYYFPQYHSLYDLQNIHDGKGSGKNPDLDSNLQRVHLQTKPVDNLAESVNFVRYIDFLPTHTIEPPWEHNEFLVATSIPIDPQNRFEPQFDFYGVNCRHYKRLSDIHFRNLGGQNNKFRKRSKWWKY